MKRKACRLIYDCAGEKGWQTHCTHAGMITLMMVASSFLFPVYTQAQNEPAPMDIDLFLDTFNRADHSDHDASGVGMWGLRSPPLGLGAAYYDSYEGGETIILGQQLRMASQGGMSETALQYNFNDNDILETGGWVIQMNIEQIDSLATDPQNRYAGFGVGLTQAEAQSGGDIAGSISFRGNGITSGSADFFVELDLEGNVKARMNGTVVASVPVGRTNGALVAAFDCASFAAGSNVIVSVYFDGVQLDMNAEGPEKTITFTWDFASANYIGLSARATGHVALDNLAVRLYPLGAALASSHALSSGLTGDEAELNADPDGDGVDNFGEWLNGGDPATADPGVRLLWVHSAPEEGGLFRFIRLIEGGKAGLTYRFRYSTTLDTHPSQWPVFEPETISSEDLDGVREQITVRIPDTLFPISSSLFVIVEGKM